MRLPSVADLPGISDGQRLSLGPDDVHLWYAPYAESDDALSREAYRAVMTKAERARSDRFVFDRDRRQFELTRALVRGVLSRYAPVAPADWRFATNEYGKPHITPPPSVSARPLWFNLSNTRGLITCAVTCAHPEIGVDTESVERAGSLLSIADRYFSPAEVTALRRRPVAGQRARFFLYWTLKESYIKARGLGLSIPLEQFSFDIPEADARRECAIRLSCDPALGDDGDSWRFWLGRWSSTHIIALGLRRPQRRPMTIAARAWIP